jgi:hypothetical protein
VAERSATTGRRAFFEDFADVMYRRHDVRAAVDTYVASANDHPMF